MGLLKEVYDCAGGLKRQLPQLRKLLRHSMASNNNKITKNQFHARPNPIITKLNTPTFQSIFTDELRVLVGLFKKHNYEIRIAGGAVRDILMEITPKDIDFATTASPEQMKVMFTEEGVRMVNTRGESHGTITSRINDKENYEVTTLRIDTVTNGRHAEVEFTTDWQQDAYRRDLTINSMFLDFDGNLYDYFYGYEDLQQKRVRFVGDATRRIQEDYLRILRYFRFYGRIARNAENHDEHILQAIRENAEGLGRISGERIWSELQKIAIGNFADKLFEKIIQCGLGPYCGLPTEPNLDELKRVYDSIKNMDEPYFPIHLIIALLNSVDDAINIHQRLKLSVFERDLAYFIKNEENKIDKEYVILNDYQKLCYKQYIKREYVEELLKHKKKIGLYREMKSWQKPHFPINGKKLRELGLPPNEHFGLILENLKKNWLESNFQLTADELLEKHLSKVVDAIKSTSPLSTRKKIKRNTLNKR